MSIARGLGHLPRLSQLRFGREMVPEERHTVRAVSSLECTPKTLGVVHIAGHDLGSERRELPRLGRLHVPRDRAGSEGALGIGRDGTDQTPALRSRSSDDRDDFLRHGCASSEIPRSLGAVRFKSQFEVWFCGFGAIGRYGTRATILALLTLDPGRAVTILN